jgi:hypothetical protein
LTANSSLEHRFGQVSNVVLAFSFFASTLFIDG